MGGKELQLWLSLILKKKISLEILSLSKQNWQFFYFEFSYINCS